METEVFQMSQDTAALLQTLRDLHADYFKLLSIMEKKHIEDKTSEAWNNLNRAFELVIGECVYSTFVLSDYIKV